MSNPTPGPYTIHGSVGIASYGVSSVKRLKCAIATFWADADDGGKEQARANAEAWIAGMKLMEKIKCLVSDYDNSKLSAAGVVHVLKVLLDELEPKP